MSQTSQQFCPDQFCVGMRCDAPFPYPPLLALNPLFFKNDFESVGINSVDAVKISALQILRQPFTNDALSAKMAHHDELQHTTE